MHHLDNAATSHPKPPAVIEAVQRCLTGGVSNPGRGTAAPALRAGALLDDARRSISAFLGLSRPNRLVFTLNATDALNLALKGLLTAGDRVVTSALEHSAVMRPLRGLAARDALRIDCISANDAGRVVPEQVAEAARGAAAVVLTCASNVTGVVQPFREVAALVEPLGVPLILDAAQAAGSLPLAADELGSRTAIAWTGHKGLLGPMGCGGLVVGEGLDLRPWREGGTGEAESPLQPEELPEHLEAGTPPLPALAGLAAGVAWWEEQGPERVRARESELADLLRRGLSNVPGVRLPGPEEGVERVPLTSFLIEGYSPDEAATLLDAEFQVTVRAGLHCARDAHAALGTLPAGTVRASVGPTTEEADVEALLAGVRALAAG